MMFHFSFCFFLISIVVSTTVEYENERGSAGFGCRAYWQCSTNVCLPDIYPALTSQVCCNWKQQFYPGCVACQSHLVSHNANDLGQCIKCLPEYKLSHGACFKPFKCSEPCKKNGQKLGAKCCWFCPTPCKYPYICQGEGKKRGAVFKLHMHQAIVLHFYLLSWYQSETMDI